MLCIQNFRKICLSWVKYISLNVCSFFFVFFFLKTLFFYHWKDFFQWNWEFCLSEWGKIVIFWIGKGPVSYLCQKTGKALHLGNVLIPVTEQNTSKTFVNWTSLHEIHLGFYNNYSKLSYTFFFVFERQNKPLTLINAPLSGSRV